MTMRCTPCCGHTWDSRSGIDEDVFGPIYWNESEKVVKCHHCMTIFLPILPTRKIERMKRHDV